MAFGAVLHQGAGPLAFFSKPFAPDIWNQLPTKGNLLALYKLSDIGDYLWGRRFVIHTDHYALKYMLDQRLSVVPQHQWISKLFGFDFAVEYRPSRLNIVADALSRRDQPDMTIATISSPTFQLYQELRQELGNNNDLWQIRDTITSARGDQWSVQEGLICHGHRVFIPATSSTLQTVLQLAHTNSQGFSILQEIT